MSWCENHSAYTQTEKQEHLFGFWYAPLSEHMFFLGNTIFYLRIEQMFAFGIDESPVLRVERLFGFYGVKIFLKNIEKVVDI